MKPRPIFVSALLLAATVALGLAVRFAPLGLPRIVVKFGGSGLWALAIYWVVSTAMGRRSVLSAGLLAVALATGIEFFKLFHAPGLDAFRLTLPGILLFGRLFSWWDVLVYWAAITAGVAIDACIRRPTSPA
jgi:hypothetical protein